MRIIAILPLLILSGCLWSQTAIDALRYSYLEVGGTARTVGVGGAIGALGADYSVLSTNPAGLAAFRTSEFVLTPAVHFAKVHSTLLTGSSNSTLSESKGNFNLNNIGLVIGNRPQNANWKTLNFGIGYNRLASFNQKSYFEGISQGSIVERFTELANDGIFDEFEVLPAIDAVAIYTDNVGGDEIYVNDFELKPGFVTDRRQTITSKGSYSELVFSMAGNYEEKVMAGITIGVPFITYEEDKIYGEEDIDDIPFFNSLTFDENLSTSGIGINLKFGMIYRASQLFRLGAAIHTPTAMALTDNFSTRLVYDFTDGGGNNNEPQFSPDGTFDYRLRTPWRLIGSAAVLFQKKGFLSADIEWIDYSLSEYNLTVNSTAPEDRDYERTVNEAISRQFQPAINLRLGGEYAYNKLRFRAGFNLNGTPYADDTATDSAFSLGFGVREQSFYLDVAYKHSGIEEGYVPYLMADPDDEQFVRREISTNQYLVTLGFKF